MQHPNFLQVSNGLRDARALCVRPGTSALVRAYEDRLAETTSIFETATLETDREYRQWRLVIASELVALKHVRVALEHARHLADEHGYDDVPARQLVYTERADMLDLVDLTVRWLRGIAGEWPWAGAAIEELERRVEECKAATASADAALARYRVAAKARVAAYGAGVAMLREFVRDASNDGSLRRDLEPVRHASGG